MHASDWKGAECWEDPGDKDGKGAGADYRGEVAKTKGGAACLSWAVQEKSDGENGLYSFHSKANGLGKHNFCRNPDTERGPWCYVVEAVEGSPRFALCDVGAVQAAGSCKGTSVHACVMHAAALLGHDGLWRGELPTRLGVFRG